MKAVILVLLLLVSSSICMAEGLPSQVLKTSAKYVGLREKSGHNDHKMIDQWALDVNLDNKYQYKRAGTGYSWCLLFVHGMYKEASTELRIPNPLPKTAGVQNFYRYAVANELRFKVIDTDDVIAGITKVPAGSIMIMLHKKGLGHTGLMTGQITRNSQNTREGNTNGDGSREGDGVYNKVRTTSSIAAVVVPK